MQWTRTEGLPDNTFAVFTSDHGWVSDNRLLDGIKGPSMQAINIERKERDQAMSDTYWIFIVMVVVTVASPGPGVLMTLDNAIAGGWKASMHGVLGLAIGAAVMAGLCSAGIGFLIRSSQPLFLLLKYCGVSYLFYLSYKTWHRTPGSLGINAGTGSVSDPKSASPGSAATGDAAPAEELWSRVVRAALLQTSNPKSLLFFLSVLPQIAASADDKVGQHARLALAIATYCIALILIHALYAGLATRARTWLSQPGIARLLSRLSATVFFAFGVTMLTLKI